MCVACLTDTDCAPAAPACNGSVYSAASACDGLGACVAGAPTDCSASGQVCDIASGCVDCLADADCVASQDGGALHCVNKACQ
jgi:hypothetical protein